MLCCLAIAFHSTQQIVPQLSVQYHHLTVKTIALVQHLPLNVCLRWVH